MKGLRAYRILARPRGTSALATLGGSWSPSPLFGPSTRVTCAASTGASCGCNLLTDHCRPLRHAPAGPAAGADDEPLRLYLTRQRIMGLRFHNVPPSDTDGPARRPARRPSPPMLCGFPPVGPAISSNHGGFQPRAARPGSPDSPSLLDHLIRPLQERRRDRQPEGLGGLEVDDQLELRRLLHGQVGGLGTFQNLVYIEC